MRVDFNVPLKNGKVPEASLPRLRAVAPEIVEYTKRGARVILATHLGRPDGHRKTSLSTHALVRPLGTCVGQGIETASDIAGSSARKMVEHLQPGRIVMLENLRFDEREEKNKRSFAKELAQLGDVYVNDAFSVSHRPHASVSAITKYLPSFAGDLLTKEVTELSKPLKEPFVLVLGGVKLETKLGLLLALGSKADAILMGGGAAVVLESIRSDRPSLATHLSPSSHEIRIGKKILRRFQDRLILPSDAILKSTGKSESIHQLGIDDLMIDIGPKTQKAFEKIMEDAKTIVWNGPMGMIEDSRACGGTTAVLRSMVHSEARTIAGGGDTLGFLDGTTLTKKLSFVSTGGGAMLAFLAGEPMPGLKPLFV